jgi:hypothetical protein
MSWVPGVGTVVSTVSTGDTVVVVVKGKGAVGAREAAIILFWRVRWDRR